jgi:hypothetical protein
MHSSQVLALSARESQDVNPTCEFGFLSTVCDANKDDLITETVEFELHTGPYKGE